jgi:preprotein translocase subunit SecG
MVMLLTFVHIAVALVLILVVLLQSARGTDLAGAFGGMGSQTAFGPRGTTTFLSKTTAGLAAVFMVTSLSLAVLSNRTRRSGSVLSGEKPGPVKAQTQQPGVPVPQIPGLPAGVKQDIQIIPATPPAPPPGLAPAPGAKAVPAQPPSTPKAPTAGAAPSNPPSGTPSTPPAAPAPSGQ